MRLSEKCIGSWEAISHQNTYVFKLCKVKKPVYKDLKMIKDHLFTEDLINKALILKYQITFVGYHYSYNFCQVPYVLEVTDIINLTPKSLYNFEHNVLLYCSFVVDVFYTGF